MLYVTELFGKVYDEKKKAQEEWFDRQSIAHVNELVTKGLSEKEIFKKFKIVFSEQEHKEAFLLDDMLKSAGYEVTRESYPSGDIVFITVRENIQY